MPHIEASGARLYVEETGQGYPIVFVHEFGSDCRELPTVLVNIFGNVARRISTRIVGDAAIGAREIPDLGFPCAAVRPELVNKHDRISLPGLLDIEPRAGSFDMWH